MGKGYYMCVTAPLLPYLTNSVYEVVLQESIPAQIRQRVPYVSKTEEQEDGFVRELTFERQPLR